MVNLKGVYSVGILSRVVYTTMGGAGAFRCRKYSPPCRRCPGHLSEGLRCPSGAPIPSWGTLLPRRFGGCRGRHRVALRRREPPIERYEPKAEAYDAGGAEISIARTAVCGRPHRKFGRFAPKFRSRTPNFRSRAPQFAVGRTALSPQTFGRAGRKLRSRGRVADRKFVVKVRPPRPNFRTEIAARTTIGPPTTLWARPS